MSHELILTPHEIDRIYNLVEALTGNCQQKEYRKEFILSNVMRRLRVKKYLDLENYIGFALTNDEEKAYLLNSVTIHTTDWFRENEHYHKFANLVATRFKDEPKLFIQSCGCSSGEELYSFGLILEDKRLSQNNSFDYQLEGFDIDPISIFEATKAIYESKDRQNIPFSYHRFLHLDYENNIMTIDANIVQRAKFYTDNLLSLKATQESQFHLLSCRNVLIYFSPDKISQILDSLARRLLTGGILILGHGDNIQVKHPLLKPLEGSLYLRI
ncbi:MAG: hypothetical protein K2X39_02010 [Silvanigrellaceae bacterium]|nr:hypothetical protein [Silvanigrellaceae bacterium]